MGEFFIQQTNVQNGDFAFQRTVIQGRPDQACGPNIFNDYNPYQLNNYRDRDMFDRCNDYENSCGCENEGADENYDFDNSDIERLLNGGLNNNNNNYDRNYYNNTNRPVVIYLSNPDSSDTRQNQPENNTLNEKIKSLEEQIAALKRENEGAPSAERTQELPATVIKTESKNQVIHKPAQTHHKNKEIIIPIFSSLQMAKCHTSPLIDISKMAKCHTDKPLFSMPIDTIKCH